MTFFKKSARLEEMATASTKSAVSKGEASSAAATRSADARDDEGTGEDRSSPSPRQYIRPPSPQLAVISKVTPSSPMKVSSKVTPSSPMKMSSKVTPLRLSQSSSTARLAKGNCSDVTDIRSTSPEDKENISDGSAEVIRKSNGDACTEEKTLRRASRDSEVETRDVGSNSSFPYKSSTVTSYSALPLEQQDIETKSTWDFFFGKRVAKKAEVTKPKESVSPVAGVRMCGLMGPAKSDAKTSEPPTNSAMELKIPDFRVRNVKNQLVIQAEQVGGVEKLKLQETRVLVPQEPTDVILKVDCSSITLQDCMVRQGKWHEKQPVPIVPGTEVVGTVHSMGYAAAAGCAFAAGDRVYVIVPSGGNAKYISVPYQHIIGVPKETDPIVSLCLASTYAPALQALDLARKKNTPFTGANVLVIGGNSPAGLATIDLALYEGANVYATASTRHHDFLKEMGAKAYPSEPEKWLPKLRGKMDVVFDLVCDDDKGPSRAALTSRGTLVDRGEIGALRRRYNRRDLKALLVSKFRLNHVMGKTVLYDRCKRYHEAPNELAQHFWFVCHLHAKGIIKPTISSTVPLKMIPFVQQSIEASDVPCGVSICTPWSTNGLSDSDIKEEAKGDSKGKTEEEKKE